MAQVKPVNKKKMSKSALVATIVAIVILVAFAVSLVASSGVFVRMQKGASSDNFDVNGSMMSYYVNSFYQNWYSNYYYYILYGLISFNPQLPLDQQYTDETKEQTYYDYFVEGAKTTVTTYLKYCEAAKADSEVNFAELEAEAENYAKESIKSLQQAAKEAGTDFKSYVRQYFGKHISKNDLKKALVIEHIASDYYEIVHDRVHESITEDREDKFFKDNLSSFVSADYLTLTINSTVEPEEIDPKAYENGKDDPAYKEAVEKANADAKKKNELLKVADQEVIDRLAKAESVEEFKKLLVEYKYDETFKSAYDTAVKGFTSTDNPSEAEWKEFAASIKQAVIDAVMAGKSDIESEGSDAAAQAEGDETETEETKWEKAKKTLPASVITALNTVIKNATKSSSYTLESDLGKFLFAGVKAHYGVDYAEGEEKGENAKAGDYFIEDKEMSEDEKESGKYSLSVYYVTEAAHRDDYSLRDVGHILFKIDTTKDTDPEVSYKTSDEAKAAAEALLEQIKAKATDGVVSKEVFEEFAKDTHDVNVFYEDVAKGQMVTNFNDWLFAAEKEGELGLVYGESSSYKGWHIVYYGGETGEEAWRPTAHDGATDEDMNTWFEELPYEVTVNEAIFDEIFG